MWFYLTFAVIAGGCATYVILNLFKNNASSAAPDGTDAATKDVDFYQRQLADIENDVASGTLSKEDAARTRVEVSRRLLDADTRAQQNTQTSSAPKAANIAMAIALVALLFGMGGYLYVALGDDGRADAPLAKRFMQADEVYKNRPTQKEAEESAPERSVTIDEQDMELINQLRTALEQRPGDAVGYKLLARQEAQLGNYAAARRAQSRVIEIAGPEKAETDDLVLLGRIMVYGTNGYVSPEAEAIWKEILRRDPNLSEARFYMGLMFTQTERPDVAYVFWEPLLETANPNAPWMQTLRDQFASVAYYAGKDFTPAAQVSDTQPGPTAEQVADAQDMTPQEREEMILGMVERLGARLETGEATAEEWARYIRTNSILGNDDIAKDAYDEAKLLFADDPVGSKFIFQSGVETGIIEAASE